jgi:hypothetical protein
MEKQNNADAENLMNSLTGSVLLSWKASKKNFFRSCWEYELTFKNGDKGYIHGYGATSKNNAKGHIGYCKKQSERVPFSLRALPADLLSDIGRNRKVYGRITKTFENIYFSVIGLLSLGLVIWGVVEVVNRFVKVLVSGEFTNLVTNYLQCFLVPATVFLLALSLSQAMLRGYYSQALPWFFYEKSKVFRQQSNRFLRGPLILVSILLYWATCSEMSYEYYLLIRLLTFFIFLAAAICALSQSQKALGWSLIVMAIIFGMAGLHAVIQLEEGESSPIKIFPRYVWIWLDLIGIAIALTARFSIQEYRPLRFFCINPENNEALYKLCKKACGGGREIIFYGKSEKKKKTSSWSDYDCEIVIKNSALEAWRVSHRELRCQTENRLKVVLCERHFPGIEAEAASENVPFFIIPRQEEDFIQFMRSRFGWIW